jgi:hypothetical protein
MTQGCVLPRRLLAILFLLLGWAGAAFAQGERPSVPKLLPEKTLAMVRAEDLPNTIERYKNGSMGRMLTDPQLTPLTEHLYKRGAEEYKNRLEGEVEVSLEDLLKIPQGEVAIALVAGPDDRLNQLGFVAFLEVADHVPQARKLIARLERLVTDNGGMVTTDMEGNVSIKTISGPDGNSIMIFDRDGMFVVSNRRPHLQEVLRRWNGEQLPTLADNPKYAGVMSRCRPGPDQPVDIEGFVDPISIVKTVARDSGGAIFLAFLPQLGLDGIQAVGATTTSGEGDFDDVIRLQVLMPTPRSGVLDLIAFKGDEAEPEAWAPDDLSSYMTVNWDVKKTYSTGASLYNSIMGEEGAFENEVRNRIDQQLGVDFASELLPALDGRLTYATWIEPPARLNSQANLVGVKLADPESFRATFKKIVEKYSERFEERVIAGTKVYAALLPNNGAPDDPNQTIRRPEPCFCVWGDYLLASDSVKFIEHCIKTGRDGKNRLASDIEFKLVLGKIARQSGGNRPGMLSYSRPEEAMRNLYDMATSEANRQRIKEQATNNGFFKTVDDALSQHPLPPFSVFEKYLAPSGGLLVLDDSGLRFMTFSLRRD